jgi:tripeptidyl-peptidase I
MLSKAALYAVLLSKLALPALAVVHEKLATVPFGWKEVGTPAADTPITLSIALSQQNLDQLESKLISVSTPGNAQYGKHLDINDINALFPPTSDTAVLAWLKAVGIANVHSNGKSVNFATTVQKANELLNTTFAYYKSGTTQKIRTIQYSIPSNLAEYIDLISPTTYFGKTTAAAAIPGATRTEKRAPASQPSVAASCQTSITPSCLKQMYSINDYKADAKSGSRIGFGSFLNQSALYSDLALFEAYFDIPSQNFSVELINGATNDQNGLTAQVGEADLDVEYIVGISHPLPVTEFITGGSP